MLGAASLASGSAGLGHREAFLFARLGEALLIGPKADQAGRMSTAPELIALSSSLDELTRRVSRILAELSPTDQDRYESDLLEVERTLGVASRRLERIVSER